MSKQGLLTNPKLNVRVVLTVKEHRQSPRPIGRARRSWAETVGRSKDLNTGTGLQLVGIVLKEDGDAGLDGIGGTLQEAHESADGNF